jgi:gamma-glutamyl-gamma-aminobutyrate hydrolase PuuD
VELPGARFVLGVQWHPEDMLGRAEQARVFSAFIAAARG